jgi:hypothetical protein
MTTPRTWAAALAATVLTSAGLAMVGAAPAAAIDLCPDGLPVNLIVGTRNADQLVGTDGPDIILGLGGGDRIEGRGGEDLIYGAGGNDVLLGGDCDDSISGGLDNDTMNGGPGNDIIGGDDGIDTAIGGSGVNLCDAEYQSATVYGSFQYFGFPGTSTYFGQGCGDEPLL